MSGGTQPAAEVQASARVAEAPTPTRGQLRHRRRLEHWQRQAGAQLARIVGDNPAAAALLAEVASLCACQLAEGCAEGPRP